MEEKADFKDANSDAMLNLGSHYYTGSMGLPIDKGTGVRLWRDAAGRFNSYNACLNMANHYGRVKNNFDKMMYYFEKAAILGSVEARLFL